MSLKLMHHIAFIFIASDSFPTKWKSCAASNDMDISDGAVGLPCESGMVLNGSKCINVTECTKPVLSGGQCLDRCPDGYVYFTMFANDEVWDTYHYTIADIKGDNPCVKQSMMWFLLGSVATANVIYCLFVWMFLSTRKFSIQKLKSWFARCKGRIFQHGDETNRLINADTGDDEDDDDGDDDCILA